MLRELFRGLETTLHERLTIIEEMLRKPLGGDGSIEQSMQIQRPDPAVLDRLAKVEATSARAMESFAMMIDTMNSLTQNVNKLMNEVSTVRSKILLVEASHTASVPVAEEVQQEIARREAAAAPELAEAEAAEVDEHEEEEEEVEEEEVEEEEVEEEEEEQELELESFVYKRNGKTYYKDPDNNVYQDDEDGNLIDSPIGVWNETTQRIHPLAK